MRKPKLILTDIDGVWTDGGMYYDQTGNEWKKFNTSDSAGIIFCNLANIPVGIITGEVTDIVKRGAKKLSINILHQGIQNKLKTANTICESLNLTLAETAYIGDDIGDINLLSAVGFSACPNNAPEYVKKRVDFITSKNGGDGAFREFIEHLFRKCGILEELITLSLIN